MPTHRVPRHCHFVSELSSTKAAGFGEEGIPLTPHMSYRLVRRKGKPRGKWLGNWCCLEGDLNVRVIVDLHDFIFHGGMWFLAIPLARVGAPSYCVVLASAVAHYLPRRRPAALGLLTTSSTTTFYFLPKFSQDFCPATQNFANPTSYEI